MDVSDYTARLNSAREQYRDSTSKMKENFKKDVENLAQAHEVKEKNQRNVFLDEKYKIEDQNEDAIERYAQKTKDEVERRKKDFSNRLEEQREFFEKDRKNTKEDFKSRLSEIDKSFKNSTKSKDRVFQQMEEDSRGRYKDALSSNRGKFEKSIQKMKKSSDENFTEYRKKMNQENRALKGEHERVREDLVYSHNINKNKASNEHQKELQRLRDNSEQKAELSDVHHQSTLKDKKKMHAIEKRELTKTFDSLTGKMQDRFHHDSDVQAEQSKRTKRELEKSFAQDRVNLERKLADVQEATSYLETTNLENSLKENFENRHKNIIEGMEKQKLEHNLKSDKASKDFQREIASKDQSQRRALAEKDDEIRAVRRNEIGSLKERQEKQVTEYQKQIAKKDIVSENQVIGFREELKDKVGNERMIADQKLKDLSADRSASLKEMKIESDKEKEEIINKMAKFRNEERLDLMESLNNKYDTKVKFYEDSIAQMNASREKTINHYEKVIERMKENAKTAMEDQKALEADRRDEDMKAFRLSFDAQKNQFEHDLRNIKDEFGKKFVKFQNQNELKLNELTDRYETQLMRERKDADKELRLKLSEADNNLKKLKLANEQETARLISQYELKIEEIRQANQVYNDTVLRERKQKQVNG